MSVVVPVYNPGRYIDPCIASLRDQTLPPDEYEVLFVDDGSTDGTSDRLAGLAASHPHLRHIRIPNSGWPGKPRNIGIAEARGEYVQFVDHDDHLAPDALRRLYDMGRRNGSDIVLGKMRSGWDSGPRSVFRADRDRVCLRDFPLHYSLTPHKMFRTAFLREKGILFPEGKRRLEDQLFMMRAYLQTEAVSVLASYTCYYYVRRDDGQNNSGARADAAGYYGNLREVLDTVLEHTEPGPARDRILRRFHQVEMLNRLGERHVLRWDQERFREMYDAIRPLALAYMGEGVDRGLGALVRRRSELLRADDPEGLVRLARATRSLRGTIRLEGLRWEGDGSLRLAFTARLVRGPEEEPLLLRRQDGRWLLPLTDDGAAGEPVDVTDEIRGFGGEVYLSHRAGAAPWPCKSWFDPRLEPRGEDTAELVVRGTGRVPAESFRGGARLDGGLWDAWATLRWLGLTRPVRIPAPQPGQAAADCPPGLLGRPPRPVLPYTPGERDLVLDVGAREAGLDKQPVLGVPGGRAVLWIAVACAAEPQPVELVFVSEEGARHPVPAILRPAAAGTRHSELRLPLRVPGLPAGPGRLALLLDGADGGPEDGPELPLCDLVVRRTGRLVPAPGLDAPAPAALRRARSLRRRATARSALKRVAGPAVRRLPPRARRRVRRLAARVAG
ncbi:glycosyltransferase family A protein [Streptomyces sp. NPDC051940]|uniref:glycosyltransferase family 2 protein n=1 Tax=Streptomyces sp. NPDC051940 TaxID=3155675 RepID=UPI00343501F3